MLTAPANWATYLANANHIKDYQLVISESDGSNSHTYGIDKIKSGIIESALLASDMWIGNCIARKFTVDTLSDVVVPRMAKIIVRMRLGLSGVYTDYVTLGTFWVDERTIGSLWTKLICYDAMLKTEQTFIDQELEEGEWPIPMADAVSEICTRCGFTLDSRTTIRTGTDYVVPYTNDLTMREVLGHIAACHGGNWTITPEGKLRLIVLQSPSASPIHTLVNSVKRYNKNGDVLTISKLTMYDDADNAFTAGDDSGYHLEIDCPYATQGIVDALCSSSGGALYGATYAPFESGGAKLDPLAELGDDVSVSDTVSVLNLIDTKIGAHNSDIASPADQEVDHEYPYLTSVQRIYDRAVKQGVMYYGTSISRAKGIYQARSDGKSEFILNSDTFAMRALIEGVMQDRVYFDPVEGDYVFKGKLSADVINALALLVTQSFYAEKGYIAGLTVDSLDTSQKLQKYLNEDTSEVNYIRIEGQNIEFCTDSTDGSQTEQARTRNGELLYWTDENYEYLTTSETAYPAMQYVYGTQLTKLKLFFEHDGEYYIPKIVFGAGTGTGNNGKLFMFKDADEFRIDYNSTTGQTWSIWIDDDGIHFDGVPEIIHETVTKIIGLVQVWVQADTPAGAKVNDLWVDTDDYSRYDVEPLTGAKTLAASDNEVITCNGTFAITLHDASYAGIVKRVFNIGTGVITLSGNINGNAGGMRLFPNESVELITDGSGWRAL
jgi:hypothetical protein